ncbi:membrane dipeptidase [Rhizobiaceae bacterium]|nr:membrane dipeptidase [Rhizobiaceae bacterium]
MNEDLHSSLVVIDGLIISNWSREVFEDMQRGGITAANCTCSVWENNRDTMIFIARWRRWFREHEDLIRPVRTADDIRKAKEENRVGIILGWQNTAGFEDRLDFIELYKDMGVGVMQLTYNTQNLVGAGCWEENDSGLTGFGREVVDEMNRVGVLIDLAHVGLKTADDAIRHSKKPCAYTHVSSKTVHDHPRNKTDDQLRFIVDRGGFVGMTTYPFLLPKGADTDLDDCLDAMEHMINVCGEANVGIGTDFGQNATEESLDRLRQDKGYARRVVAARGVPLETKGLNKLSQFPRLTQTMQKRGWTESRIAAVMGENWLRFLGEVWDV